MSVRRPQVVLGSLVANTVPLVGVLFLGWNALAFVVVYWVELIVASAFDTLRALVAEGLTSSDVVGTDDGTFAFDRLDHKRGGWSFGSSGPTVYLRNVPEAASSLLVSGLFAFILAFVLVVGLGARGGLGSFSLTHVALGVAGVVVGRGVDFSGHLLRGEYRDAYADRAMGRAVKYSTGGFLAVVIGTLLTDHFGLPVAVLAAVVCVKLVVDAIGALGWTAGVTVEPPSVDEPEWFRELPSGEPAGVVRPRVGRYLLSLLPGTLVFLGVALGVFLLPVGFIVGAIFGVAAGVAAAVGAVLIAAGVVLSTHYLRLRGVEHRIFDDGIAAYDAWLGEVQWVVPFERIDEVDHDSAAVLGLESVTVRVVDCGVERTLRAIPDADGVRTAIERRATDAVTRGSGTAT